MTQFKKVVPETVFHDDFRAAIAPLLALCGVTDDEVFDVHVTTGGVDLARVSFQLIARTEGDDAEHPVGTNLASAPQPNLELTWPCNVRVI